MRIRTHKANFAIISNVTAQDGNLSWEALGLLVYCLSMPEVWEFHPKQIWKTQSGRGGRDKTYKLFQELIQTYHCILVREKREDNLAGSSTYEIFDDAEDCKKRISELENQPFFLTHGSNFKESFRYPENTDPDLQDLINKQVLKETKELLLPYPSSSESDPFPSSEQVVVVISSHLNKLKLTDQVKKKISEEHSEADIAIAVERCLKWRGRPNDEAGLITALKQKGTWNDVESAQEASERKDLEVGSTIEENLNWARFYLKQVEEKFPSVMSHVKLNGTGVTIKIKNGWFPLGYLDENFKETFIFSIKQALEGKN